MQNRYAGDIGDYVKFALLRALSPGMRLGIGWYLFPDEGHNEDGTHVSYLDHPENWRGLDPQLFDELRLVAKRSRSVSALELTDSIDATFFGDPLEDPQVAPRLRSEFRSSWFNRLQDRLAHCNLVFVDPDNGLTDDRPERRKSRRFGKQIPLQEALVLAQNRSLVVYHHNSRFKGGHDREVEHWRTQLGGGTLAVRANAYSCRTFFLVNPNSSMVERARRFCDLWASHKVRLDE